MTSIRHPELWDERHALLALVEQYKLARVGGEGGGAAAERERRSRLAEPLSSDEWRAVLSEMASRHDPRWLPVWAFTTADVGKTVSVQEDRVKVFTNGAQDGVDGKVRLVRWDDARHPSCEGRIVSVEPRLHGAVRLADVRYDEGGGARGGLSLQNPELEDLGAVLRQAIKRADRILTEAQEERPVVRLGPEEREELDAWTVAEVELPTVHVRGRFVLWQGGRPAHVVYPALYEKMPTLLSRGSSRAARSLSPPRARGAARPVRPPRARAALRARPQHAHARRARPTRTSSPRLATAPRPAFAAAARPPAGASRSG